MGDGFDLRDHAWLPAARDGNDLAFARAGLRLLRSPVVRNGVAVLIRKVAVQAGAQPNANK